MDMKKNIILIIIIALFVGGIFGYLITKNKGQDELVGSNNISMDNMHDMDHSMMMMVSSEKEFLQEMIPHHQEAVDTAKEVLERGSSTEGVRTLVKNIILAQEKEIAEMKQWYQNWYDETYTPTGNYQNMMRELDGLSGKEIDTVFLEDMIIHHMGAIMMAESVQQFIEHQEIKDLTNAL